MEKLFRISLFVAGVINFIPALLAIFPEKLPESYGIQIPNADYELLLRHRGIMLGIIGGFMIYAAIAKKYYGASVVLGMISMVSFVLFFYGIGGINAALGTVMKIDLLAILILMLGFALFKLKK